MSVLDQFRLDGRVAVVTGGGGGLGSSTAEALAEAGARVIVVGRSQDVLVKTVDRITGAAGMADHRVTDVSDEADVGDLFDWVEHEYGPVDVLVNNAAVADEAAFVDVTVADWDRVLNINARGVFLASRALARQEHSGTRSIINVSSLAASVGVKNQAAYSASKGAVTSLTRALAIELAVSSIRVNALAPGYFHTDMPAQVLAHERARDALLRRIPQRRVPDPREIGPSMVYLASDASAFMTGSTIHLDGGYTAQ